jgi:hypothetical protein
MIIIFVLPALAAKERPLVIGPSMNVRTDWLTNFLDALGSTKILDVISYHMYPGYGRSLDLPHLIPTPAWLDFPHSVASQVKSAVAMSSRGVDLLNGGLELWIDETAAAWASGKLWLTSRLLSMVYAYTYRTTPAFSSRLLSMVYAYTYRTTPAFCYHLFHHPPARTQARLVYAMAFSLGSGGWISLLRRRARVTAQCAANALWAATIPSLNSVRTRTAQRSQRGPQTRTIIARGSGAFSLRGRQRRVG